MVRVSTATEVGKTCLLGVLDNNVILLSEHGEVHIWDMNTRMCVHKFVDDGCIVGTSISVSPTQQFLACGSSSGVVNLYNTSKLENTTIPKPDKGCFFKAAYIIQTLNRFCFSSA